MGDIIENNFIPIKDFETYAINTNGDIKDLRSEKLVIKYKSMDEYWIVSLINKNGHSIQRIHRLLAIHFIPNPNNELQIDHINRNREDNTINNLRWVSHSENQINKLYDNTKYKKYITLEDVKSKKCSNPSWRIHINNTKCQFRKRYQFAKYTYEDIIKIRNDLLTRHDIPILD